MIVSSRQIVFLLLVIATFGWTERITAQIKEIIDGARNEGQLVLSALEKKYPYIGTTFYRATCPALVSRIQTEQRAGGPGGFGNGSDITGHHQPTYTAGTSAGK